MNKPHNKDWPCWKIGNTEFRETPSKLDIEINGGQLVPREDLENFAREVLFKSEFERIRYKLKALGFDLPPLPKSSFELIVEEVTDDSDDSNETSKHERLD